MGRDQLSPSWASSRCRTTLHGPVRDTAVLRGPKGGRLYGSVAAVTFLSPSGLVKQLTTPLGIEGRPNNVQIRLCSVILDRFPSRDLLILEPEVTILRLNV